MVSVWIPSLQYNLTCAMHSEYMVHKPNIYTTCYLKCDNIFNQIEMRKYPQKCFQLCYLPVGHIHWNKGANLHSFGSPWQFSIDIWNGMFLYQMTAQETNLRHKCWVMSFRDPSGVSDDVISAHARIGTYHTTGCLCLHWDVVLLYNTTSDDSKNVPFIWIQSLEDKYGSTSSSTWTPKHIYPNDKSMIQRFKQFDSSTNCPKDLVIKMNIEAKAHIYRWWCFELRNNWLTVSDWLWYTYILLILFPITPTELESLNIPCDIDAIKADNIFPLRRLSTCLSYNDYHIQCWSGQERIIKGPAASKQVNKNDLEEYHGIRNEWVHQLFKHAKIKTSV